MEGRVRKKQTSLQDSHRCWKTGGGYVLNGCDEGQDDLPFDTTDHVAIKSTTFEETKTEGTPGLDHTTAVREHLNTANFKHGTIFG